MSAIEQFKRQKYLNLETLRKSGESMRTPVWFVLDGENFYVSTLANSGKVKRIRNNGRVNLAACKMDGKVTGVWTPAQAREVADPEIISKVNSLLDKKYGLMKKIFDKQRASKGVKDTILEIKLIE
jgi:PPOX class probable F420-dependent enzyme